MNEDKLKALLQQDQSLRDAIRQEEAERPQMPADLNARVMHDSGPGWLRPVWQACWWCY